MGLSISGFGAETNRLISIINKNIMLLNTSSLRLATGRRINSAKDDPAGLVAVSRLEAEIKAIDAAAENGRRADAMLNIADGALAEVNSLLTEIQGLAVASANDTGLSSAEIAANQAQIDSAISSIDRIISTTSFNGKRLLDGSMGVSISGSDATKVDNVRVFGRPSNSSSVSVSISLDTAATKATVTGFATTSATTSTQISVTGNLGTASITISTGENLSSVAYKVNQVSAQTGVTASATAANTNLSFQSQDYGDDAFVIVDTVSGDTTNYGDVSITSGTDAVVTVNGQSASVDGLLVSANISGVSVEFALTSSYNQGSLPSATSFTVGSGGATFALGPNARSRVTIGIPSLSSANVGSASLGSLASVKSGGANSVTSNPSSAIAIIRDAVNQVVRERGRIGGFQKHTIQSSINVAANTSIQLMSAKSAILDADLAFETSRLNRQQLLISTGISLLAILNQQQSNVLKLLGA